MIDKIKDIARGFWNAYCWTYDMNIAIASSRLQTCNRCNYKKKYRCSICGCFLTPKAYCISGTNDCPIGNWVKFDKLPTRDNLAARCAGKIVPIVKELKGLYGDLDLKEFHIKVSNTDRCDLVWLIPTELPANKLGLFYSALRRYKDAVEIIKIMKEYDRISEERERGQDVFGAGFEVSRGGRT